MKELELKYGCNPNQKPARVFVKDGDIPFTVLNDATATASDVADGTTAYVKGAEQLAAGAGAEKGHRPASRRLLQACKPGRCCRSCSTA